MTSCVALNVPYSQNFDAVTQPAIPSCMAVENTNADASLWKTCTSTSLIGCGRNDGGPSLF